MSELPEDLNALLRRGYGYALGLAHDPVLAEDLLQEACLRVVRAGGPWSAPYLLAVIRNRFIDECRRRKRVRFQRLEAEPTRDPAVEGSVDIEKALGRLPKEEREFLYLNAVEGYTASEIAELTSRPRGTILSLIHRAKSKLRRMLSTAQAPQAAKDAS